MAYIPNLKVKYRDEINTIDPEIGLRDLLNRHPDDLAEVEVTDSSILIDIDTQEDYVQLLLKQHKLWKN